MNFLLSSSPEKRTLSTFDQDHLSSRKHAFIILTPLNPTLYSKTGVYRGIHYFSYFCSKHRLWVLVRTASPRGGSKEYPQSMFEQKYEKYQNFLPKNFHFFFFFFFLVVVKFSVYLNRRVFLMIFICMKYQYF